MGAHSGVMERPAFSVPAKKMAMWVFIIADTATFAACLVAYGFIRNATPNWPRPFHSITNVALMTFILVTSSLTMVFALLHIRQWLALIDEGMTLFKNPWGTGQFGAAFFSITGLHLLHVTGGVIALVAVGIRYQRGRDGADDLEITGLYWHFVDLVWMFVVPLVYLMNLAH